MLASKIKQIDFLLKIVRTAQFRSLAGHNHGSKSCQIVERPTALAVAEW